ncbi:MAG TPA: response regulator [Acidimicrobiales bacterium]
MTVRVLIAEDNEDHRFLTVRALQDVPDVDLAIETVADGEEALDYVHGRRAYAGKQRPDLVLLDIRMPKVDGLEVLRQLKADPSLRTIPTVVLSSSDRAEDINTAYELGSNSYVTKPATASGMRAGLRQLGEYWTLLAALPSA